MSDSFIRQVNVPEPAEGERAAVRPPDTVNELAELIADLLEPTGLVAADRLAALRGRLGVSESFAQRLRDEGLASDEGVARVLAQRHHLQFVDLAAEQISPEAVEAIPVAVLRRVEALPYRLEGRLLHVAITNPADVAAIDELRLSTSYVIELGIAPRERLLTELMTLTRKTDTLESRVGAELRAIEQVKEEEEELEDLEADDGVSDAPLVRLVNALIFQAAEDGASDVHVEPQEDCLLVRFRIDGVLQEMQRIPKRLSNGVTTRLKVLAKLDIAERRKPQDGRLSLNAAAAGRVLDIRIATLPTVEGESVVMRLLDKSRRAPTLEELGLSEEMRAQLREIVRRPTGALIVTGPTGSGKTTTLYAALAELNRPEINIITVEDPVEYRLAGVNQVQINTKAGLTFATALRSILRSDPDVVMVGEIRDSETAKISIEAALTGHFVLSTLHTNDAPSTLTRLNEMGVEPFLTASAVSAVLAQRLARKLCSHCCELYSPSVEELLAARVSPDVAAGHDGVVFYRKRGCPRCNQTGYRGRVGIYQLLTMTEELESLAAVRATREEIERAALRGGMRTLWDDGLAKVAAGLTSVEELARVSN
ncbi:MAG TPA: GspE/PulE family protein [Gaiellaceae bacterium]|nr:GspE/PulE family protein [Gaiellaceae bacterium]